MLAGPMVPAAPGLFSITIVWPRCFSVAARARACRCRSRRPPARARPGSPAGRETAAPARRSRTPTIAAASSKALFIVVLPRFADRNFPAIVAAHDARNRGLHRNGGDCGVLAVENRAGRFSWDDQVKTRRQGRAWTGVRNFHARKNLKAMKKGEHAFFYHTGNEKQIVGIVEIIREAYKDPTDEKGVFDAVDTTRGRAVQDAGDARDREGRREAEDHEAGARAAPLGAAGDATRSGRSSARWAG